MVLALGLRSLGLSQQAQTLHVVPMYPPLTPTRVVNETSSRSIQNYQRHVVADFRVNLIWAHEVGVGDPNTPPELGIRTPVQSADCATNSLEI